MTKLGYEEAEDQWKQEGGDGETVMSLSKKSQDFKIFFLNNLIFFINL